MPYGELALLTLPNLDHLVDENTSEYFKLNFLYENRQIYQNRKRPPGVSRRKAAVGILHPPHENT